MTLAEFAEKHRLRVKRAEDGEPIISGRLGHVYEHDQSTLALMFMPTGPRRWPRARRKLEDAGFTIWQDADHEGSALFDPTDTAQARLALKVVGAKRKRTLTAEQRAAKVTILERARAAKMAVVQVS